MHFPPYFRFPPLFQKKCRTFWNIFPILPFPDKFLDFHPPKFLMTFFLVIDHKFRIFPLFSLFQYISTLFRENYSFPLLLQIFPLCFRQIHLLFTYFTLIFSPLLWPWCIYASPNARTGRLCFGSSPRLYPHLQEIIFSLASIHSQLFWLFAALCSFMLATVSNTSTASCIISGLAVSGAGLPIERFGVQIPAKAEIWFQISAPPASPS